MNSERFLPGSLPHGLPKLDSNPLSLSWHDSAWIPMLNTANIMDYFAERSNPFYDRTCNNENLKMQRLGPEHLGNMIGLEYCLLHVQEPILYVIRKQHRHSPTQVTPIADYYILAGIVYQAPDLANVIGSRLLTTVHHMQTAFDEASSFAQFHPSKGYWWQYKENEKSDDQKKKNKEEPGSTFQRRRVDILLAELAKKFPPKLPSPPQLEKQTTEETSVRTEVKVEIKTEKVEPSTTSSTATTTTTTNASATTAVTTTTTTTAAPLLPPPPPPAPTAAASTAAAAATATAASQRTAMKPPPEKRPRLL